MINDGFSILVDKLSFIAFGRQCLEPMSFEPTKANEALKTRQVAAQRRSKLLLSISNRISAATQI